MTELGDGEMLDCKLSEQMTMSLTAMLGMGRDMTSVLAGFLEHGDVLAASTVLMDMISLHNYMGVALADSLGEATRPVARMDEDEGAAYMEQKGIEAAQRYCVAIKLAVETRAKESLRAMGEDDNLDELPGEAKYNDPESLAGETVTKLNEWMLQALRMHTSK